MKSRKISLLLLTYNRLGMVARCLKSLAPTLKSPVVEWVILDNASTDGTAAWIHKLSTRHDNVRVELSAINTGVSGGRKRLVELATGDTLVFLDSDVEARRRDWLQALTAPLTDHTVGVVGCGGHMLSADWRHYIPHPDAGDVDCVSGYCQAFRRDLLDAGVAMDTAFGRYWHEDTDWCLQARHLGYSVQCTGDIGLHHIYAASGDDGSEAVKQRYLASKWKGKGVIHAERLQHASGGQAIA